MTSRDPKGAVRQYGRLSAILATAWLLVDISNGDISAMGHRIHFMFGSTVWFSGRPI